MSPVKPAGYWVSCKQASLNIVLINVFRFSLSYMHNIHTLKTTEFRGRNTAKDSIIHKPLHTFPYCNRAQLNTRWSWIYGLGIITVWRNRTMRYHLFVPVRTTCFWNVNFTASVWMMIQNILFEMLIFQQILLWQWSSLLANAILIHYVCTESIAVLVTISKPVKLCMDNRDHSPNHNQWGYMILTCCIFSNACKRNYRS